MKLKPDQTILFIGDSITDAGRAKPAGEGRGDALGHGYVALIDALLNTWYPDYRLRVINKGISGNTVRDLKQRWQSDVIDYAPHWLSIMIGINDVWRQFDSPRRTEIHVYPEEYEATLHELIESAREYVKEGIILCSPYMIEPNPEEPMRKRMDQYREICRQTAQAKGLLFVDTQAAFDKTLVHIHPMTYAWDRIHPNPAGHMLLARTILSAVGFEWERNP